MIFETSKTRVPTVRIAEFFQYRVSSVKGRRNPKFGNSRVNKYIFIVIFRFKMALDEIVAQGQFSRRTERELSYIYEFQSEVEYRVYQQKVPFLQENRQFWAHFFILQLFVPLECRHRSETARNQQISIFCFRALSRFFFNSKKKYFFVPKKYFFLELKKKIWTKL